ncbi:MAG: MFS transporter [Pirellulaceae bacterium]|nr:MFS transporter [Pirellulaceae bacterium]
MSENYDLRDQFDKAVQPTVTSGQLPPLMSDRSFIGMTVTQFLGAFNDNLFKQLMLLLSLKVAVVDRQPLAMLVFSVPFLLFSGYAGFLSDRHSKRSVIVASKIAEIFVMLLGMTAFLVYGKLGFAGLLAVLFLMGTQSAFFGPGKYGILPEMLRQEDLPRANGIILMTTFLAIIFGTASAGFLSSYVTGDAANVDAATATQYWRASAICVLIAIVGAGTSLAIRRLQPSSPQLRLSASVFAVSSDTLKLLRQDRPLVTALLASCMFWMLAGVTQQAVNSFGMHQLEIGDDKTSILAASIGIGIALGAVVAGRLSRSPTDFRVMNWGAWGMVIFLGLLALPGSQHGHLWGFSWSIGLLVVVGISTGMFAIPLQVFLQSRPPMGYKGRLIAAMNQANFLAIVLSSGVYWGFDLLVRQLGWNRSPIFAFTALIMLPVAIFYRPKSETVKP